MKKIVGQKGVSDLTWEEAYANYIPRENWEEHCRRFGKSKKIDIIIVPRSNVRFWAKRTLASVLF